MFKPKSSEVNVMKGIFIAYFVLLFHLGLLCLIGLLVLFFSGILNYLPWILLGCFGLLGGSGYLVLRYIRKKSGSLVRMLSMPEFRGKNIEVNVLGGLASLKIQGSGEIPGQIASDQQPSKGPGSARVEAIGRLAGMPDDGPMPDDGFRRAEQRRFDP